MVDLLQSKIILCGTKMDLREDAAFVTDTHRNSPFVLRFCLTARLRFQRTGESLEC